ncbi:MAG: peptidase [Syntrophorhabdaceae bacterium PtaU1.Bin034]|nr:MAG: peptidase [Syntrophorhabdaceae bacterium PtaU1.Bin034]
MHCSEKKYMAGFTLDEDHPLVLAASRAVSSELGRKPLIYRWNFATDGGYSMTALGIPTIGFSPCEEHLAHVVNEYVRIDYMIEAAKAYAALIIELAG